MLSRACKTTETKTNYKNDVIVAGSDNILVTMGACCNPVPGDEIIGFVTKGKGVTIHKKDCSNVQNKSDRLIDVAWNKNLSLNSFYDVKLTIKTNTLNNHILEIVTKASFKNVSITSIKEFNIGKALDYELIVKVKNNEELDNYIEELKLLKFVLEVIR